VHPARGERRVRGPDGGPARPLPPAVQPAAAAGVHRRGAEATGQRDPVLDPGETGRTGPAGLRVPPGGGGQPVHDLRAATGLEGGAGDRAADRGGFRRGAPLGGRGPAPGRRSGSLGDGQPQHPRPGLPVRGTRPGPGQADRPEAGVALHPEARELAERRRVRAGRPVPTVPGPPDRGDRRLRQVVAAWEEERNERQVGVHWRFTTAGARIRLRRLYPSDAPRPERCST
jgi:hypothetical protein